MVAYQMIMLYSMKWNRAIYCLKSFGDTLNMSLKAKINRRITQQVQEGISLEEASFNARQWAKRMRAKERLEAKKKPAQIEEEEHGKKENTSSPKKRGRPAKGTKRWFWLDSRSQTRRNTRKNIKPDAGRSTLSE